MADHNFYETTNNHNQRELTIVNVALLVGKAPTKEKRVRIKVRMIMSGHPNMGAPDWLSAAQIFVSQWHDPVYPAIDFKGYDLHFSTENLFGAEGVKSPRCQMRSFEVAEFGPSEQPDVVANFVIYSPFSTALWAWLGQYGGDSCWCSLTPGLGEAGSASEDEPDGDNEDEIDADEPDEDTENSDDQDEDTGLALVPSGGKSSAKDLAAYHLDELEKEAKRGRGRPRKTPVDPLTVDAATAF